MLSLATSRHSALLRYRKGVVHTSKRPGECQVCQADPDTLVALPQARGNDKVLGCIPCAIRLGLYCERHERPHTAFDDGLSACLRCIEAESGRREESGEELLRVLRPLLRKDERDELDEWLESVVEITGDSEGRCFMRALVGKALRLNEPVEAIKRRIVTERSIRLIF